MRGLLAALLLAAPAAAQDRPPGFDEPIAGPGVAGCAAVTGVENVMNLAQSTDWAMGYLAGRMDAGDAPAPGHGRDLVDPIDLAFQIGAYCAENPYGLVLDALRDYGREVFAAGPMPEPLSQPRLPSDAPEGRPAIWPPVPGEDLTAGAAAAVDRPRARPDELDTTIVTRSPSSRSRARPLYDSIPSE